MSIPEDFISEVSDEVASATNEIYSDLGRLGEYSNKSSPFVFLNMWADKSNHTQDNILKMRGDELARDIMIPSQIATDGTTAFPPPNGGIAVYDQIIWDNIIYSIRSFENKDGIEALWRCHCVATQIRNVGTNYSQAS